MNAVHYLGIIVSTDIGSCDHLAFWSSWSHPMPWIREDVGSSPAPGDPVITVHHEEPD